MTIEEILQKHFGWTTKDVLRNRDRFLHMNKDDLDEVDVLNMSEYYKNEFGLSQEELDKMVKANPLMVSYSEQDMSDIMLMYERNFGINKSTFTKMFKTTPSLPGFSAENIQKKMDYYETEFGVDRAQFVKLFKSMPSLITYSRHGVTNKVNFFEREFGVEKEIFAKIFKKMPAIISYSESNITDLADCFGAEFGILPYEFGEIISKQPSLLGYSEDKIKTRAGFYLEEFDINNDQLVSMIKSQPGILTFLEDSVREKHKQIAGLRLTDDYVVDMPDILNAPADVLKLRYTILRQIAEREDIIAQRGWYIPSQNKTYAKVAYMQEIEESPKLRRVLTDDKRFQKTYEVHPDDLVEQYGLTMDVIRDMESVLLPGEIEPYTTREHEFLEREYGEKE